MKIIAMGTGSDSGTPRIGCNCTACRSSAPKDKRLRASLAIEKNNKFLIADVGPDFRQQLLRYKIGFNDIEGAVITHAHNDHCIGVWERTAIAQDQLKPLTLYSDPQIVSYYFDQNSSFYYLRSSGVVAPREIEVGKRIRTENFSFKTFEIPHTPKFLGPTLGLSFDDKKFVYVVETSAITEGMKKEIDGADVLFMNGSFLNENLFAHISIKKSIPILNKLCVGKVYFIGLNHNQGTHAMVEKYLKPYGYKLAYDGMKVSI
jgi:phosphoribosyl 1,2-cyclic phosphate phosphodiesterase